MKTVVTYHSADNSYSFAVIAAEQEGVIHLLEDQKDVRLLSTAVNSKRDKRNAIAKALADKPSLFNALQDLACKHELAWAEVVKLAMPVGSTHLFYERREGEVNELMYLINTGQGLMYGGWLYDAEQAYLVSDAYLYTYHATVKSSELTDLHARVAPNDLLMLTLTQLCKNQPR